MNTVFSIIRNADFAKDQKHKLFLKSIANLDSNTKVVIVNSTSVEMDTLGNKFETINVTPMGSDLNIFGAISGYLNQNKLNHDDYILVSDIENIVFTRNPFSFLKHFNKDLYFYSLKYVSNETTKKKSDYENFLKTCNYFMGNDYESFSVGSHIFAGKNQVFKALLLTLFLEVNRNSAHLITTEAVLSYIHKHLAALYNVAMFTNQFCKVVENQNMAESILEDDEQSKKQYLIIHS